MFLKFYLTPLKLNSHSNNVQPISVDRYYNIIIKYIRLSTSAAISHEIRELKVRCYIIFSKYSAQKREL